MNNINHFYKAKEQKVWSLTDFFKVAEESQERKIKLEGRKKWFEFEGLR